MFATLATIGTWSRDVALLGMGLGYVGPVSVLLAFNAHFEGLLFALAFCLIPSALGMFVGTVCGLLLGIASCRLHPLVVALSGSPLGWACGYSVGHALGVPDVDVLGGLVGAFVLGLGLLPYAAVRATGRPGWPVMACLIGIAPVAALFALVTHQVVGGGF